MDIAAELIGIPLFIRTKPPGFRHIVLIIAASPARMMVFFWLGNAEPESVQHQSVRLPGAVHWSIIGGLGSLTGSFFGAALIFGLLIVLRMIKTALDLPMTSATLEHINPMTLGTHHLFLIAEPNGLARLWQIGKQKLRVWPFPY